MTNKTSARRQEIRPRWWIGPLVVCGAAISLPAFAAAPSVREARAVERANALLAQMTHEEKIAFAASGAALVTCLCVT